MASIHSAKQQHSNCLSLRMSTNSTVFRICIILVSDIFLCTVYHFQKTSNAQKNMPYYLGSLSKFMLRPFLSKNLCSELKGPTTEIVDSHVYIQKFVPVDNYLRTFLFNCFNTNHVFTDLNSFLQSLDQNIFIINEIKRLLFSFSTPSLKSSVCIDQKPKLTMC